MPHAEIAAPPASPRVLIIGSAKTSNFLAANSNDPNLSGLTGEYALIHSYAQHRAFTVDTGTFRCSVVQRDCF
jgi:hypothetical protein